MMKYDPIEALVYSLTKESVSESYFWSQVNLIKKRYRLSTKRTLLLVDKYIRKYCYSYDFVHPVYGYYMAPPYKDML